MRIFFSFTQDMLLLFYSDNNITLVVISVAAIDEAKRLETQKHVLLFGCCRLLFQARVKTKYTKIYNSSIIC